MKFVIFPIVMDKKKFKLLMIILGVLTLLCAVILLIVIFSEKKPQDPQNINDFSEITAEYGDFSCISLTFGADPATTANITWQSFTQSEGSVVYCKASDFSDFSSLTNSAAAAIEKTELSVPAKGQTTFKNPELCEVPAHVMRVYLENLEPGTAYKYAIKSGDKSSAVYSFKTPDSDEVFTFALVSDTQGFTTSDYEYSGRTFRAAASKKPDFFVHMGDTVEDGKNIRQWKLYWDSAAGIFENSAVISVVGNQDKKNTLIHYTYGSSDNRTALVSGYYSFNVGKVHFSVLNTGDGDKDIPKAQLKWLKNDLEAADGLRKIVLIHKAPYSNYNHCLDSEILEIRAQLDPIFSEYGVDVVLEGHDHVFYRSAPLVNGQNSSFTTEENNGITTYRRNGAGTVFFMNSSSGVKQHSGAALDSSIPCEKSSLMKEPTYTLVSVDPDKIIFNTYTVSNDDSEKLFDSFGLYW